MVDARQPGNNAEIAHEGNERAANLDRVDPLKGYKSGHAYHTNLEPVSDFLPLEISRWNFILSTQYLPS